jgi:hypothetical protein
MAVPAPKWFTPVAVVALLWNLLGCFAVLSDALTAYKGLDAANAAQQAAEAARPAWGAIASAAAVLAGALGCVGLILRRHWSRLFLLVSLVAVLAQDLDLFALGPTAGRAAGFAIVLQSIVLLIAIGLAWMAQAAIKRGWIP